MFKHWTESSFASFDTETTGLDTDTSRIVSIALLRVEPDGSVVLRRMVAVFSQLRGSSIGALQQMQAQASRDIYQRMGWRMRCEWLGYDS